jgi:hypothetical protein
MGAIGALNVFTYTLTNQTLTISASQNVTRLTVLCRQGSITFTGSASFNGITSGSITFAVNQGVTISAPSPSNPIDGIVIAAASGGDIADIVIAYQ